ncbi:MAG: histidine phosphotransferase family protein, partial [Stellaceae bacterium]
MSVTIDMRVMEMLNARLCHELAGPVSAVVNGVELMSEEDPDFVADALRLVGTSARTVSRRLQFYRFAYGTLPGEGAASAIGRDMAQKYFEAGNVHCDWPLEEATRPHAWQRLACVLLVLAAEALPRGGTVAVRGHGLGMAVEADGDTVRLTPEAQAGLRSDLPIENLTARGVHAHLCQLFAADLKLRVAPLKLEPRRMRLELVPV